MILGHGVDIIELERIAESLEKHGDRFLHRIFTEEELSYCLQYQDPTPPLAARFAAKEAIAKAFGCGIGEEIGWHDMVILRDEAGKPEVRLSAALLEKFKSPRILLSMSHCKTYAVASAIWVRE